MRVKQMELTKKCTACERELPTNREYFYKDSKGKDGLYSKCKECHVKKTKAYYRKNSEKYQHSRDTNKDKSAEYRKGYYEQNKEHLLIEKQEYRKENRQQVLGQMKSYKKRNKEKIRGLNQKRRAVKAALPATLTSEQWAEILMVFEYECAYCGEKESLQQDHFVPVTKSGGYVRNNIVPACGRCNNSKSNTDYSEWYPKKSFYCPDREAKIMTHVEERAKGGVLDD